MRSNKTVTCVCEHCKKSFEKELFRYKWNLKNGTRFVCSKECRRGLQTTSIQVKCTTCGKDISVNLSVFNKRKSKKFFCCTSCSVKHSNVTRGSRSQDTKDKIRKSLERFYRDENQICKTQILTCNVCNKEFKSKKKNAMCCSRNCHQVLKFGVVPCTKDELVNAIVQFAQDNNRSPQKREMDHRIYHAAVRFFGAWNKAIESSGLKPNKSKFQITRLKTKDGHMADSISEKIVDDTLHQSGLIHERNKVYPGQEPGSRLNCDFYIPQYDLWFEYFGLHGQDEAYDLKVERKKQLAVKEGLIFAFMSQDDLFPENKTIEIINALLFKHGIIR